MMMADLVPYDENKDDKTTKNVSKTTSKRGLQSRKRGAGATSANIVSSAKKQKKSGIPPPKITVATPSKKHIKAITSKSVAKSAARRSKTRTPAATSSSSSSSSFTTATATSFVNDLTNALSEQTTQLTNLKDSVITSKPILKGVAKSNYRERMNKFEESYKTLRKSAGDYQKKAFIFLEKVTRVEQNMADEYRSAVAEAETLRSSCESFESEMSESHKQLTVLRTECISLKKEGKQLEENTKILNQRVHTLEKESVQQASSKATLQAQVTNYESRTKEQAVQLETQTQQHRDEMIKIQNDLNERFDLKINGLNEKLIHMTSTLEKVRQELTTSTSKTMALELQLTTMTTELTALRTQLSQNALEMQQFALKDVKQTAEIQHLTSSLDSKNKEMDRAMDGLKHTQSMSERRVDELSTEKNEMKQKVDTMETERRELESTNTTLKTELDTTSRNLETEQATTTRLEMEIKQLNTSMIEETTRRTIAEEKCVTLDTDLSTTKTNLDEITSAHQTLQHVHAQHVTKTEHTIETLQKDLNTATTRGDTFEKLLNETNQEKDNLTTQLKVVQSSAGASAQDQLENMMRITVENENLKKRLGVDQGVDLLSQAQEKVRLLEQRVYASDAIRRKLHNKVQELRGNVRVAVRVRPLLGNEPESEDPSLRASGGAIKVDDVCGEETDSMELSIVSGAGAGKKMSFDKVFGQSCDQKNVFKEVSELVQSALDGYNVCIFAYGQTGSGKTFTMQGGNTDESRGIIPRSIAQILESSQAMNADGWEFNIKASFLEIYNEEIVDLLSPHQPMKKSMQKKGGSMSFGDNKKKKSNSDRPKLVVRQMDTGMSIEGLEEIELKDFSQLNSIMGRAEKNRSVSATAMNSESSRSHCAFILHITGTNVKRNKTVEGCLNLVDLAGSERLKRSGATGAAAKETAAINKSLSALVDVFDAISKKKSHVPFRNSKLTYLMQSCLSGNGKTMMIVNVSPTTASGGETLCSLRFAKQVNQTELGRAKKNSGSSSSSSSGSVAKRRGTGGPGGRDAKRSRR